MLTVLLGDEGAKTWIREEKPRRKTASSCVFTAQVCRETSRTDFHVDLLSCLKFSMASEPSSRAQLLRLAVMSCPSSLKQHRAWRSSPFQGDRDHWSLQLLWPHLTPENCSRCPPSIKSH